MGKPVPMFCFLLLFFSDYMHEYVLPLFTGCILQSRNPFKLMFQANSLCFHKELVISYIHRSYKWREKVLRFIGKMNSAEWRGYYTHQSIRIHCFTYILVVIMNSNGPNTSSLFQVSIIHNTKRTSLRAMAHKLFTAESM